MPIVSFVSSGTAERAAAFRKGLNETGYFEGQNVIVEYHWLEGQYDRLPALMADLVRRRVAVIAAPANAPALAAKAATATGTGTTSSTMPSTPASAEVALGPLPNLPKAVRAACRAV
jgi:hypothetical protein